MVAIPVSGFTTFQVMDLAGFTINLRTLLALSLLVKQYPHRGLKEGMPSAETVVKDMMARFNPILMTTIAVVIIMIPIAIANGAVSEWKNDLVRVLISGLTCSMILTLIVETVMYPGADGAKEWRGKMQIVELPKTTD